jgi:hypothetical protein
MAISRNEVLMGRDQEYALTPDLEKNLGKLLVALNLFRTAYKKPMVVSSGYRPGRYNEKAGGATKSAHLSCEACDFKDADGAIKQFVLDKPKILVDCGLYMEHPADTPTWCHLQIRPTINRIFRK